MASHPYGDGRHGALPRSPLQSSAPVLQLTRAHSSSLIRACLRPQQTALPRLHHLRRGSTASDWLMCGYKAQPSYLDWRASWMIDWGLRHSSCLAVSFPCCPIGLPTSFFMCLPLITFQALQPASESGSRKPHLRLLLSSLSLDHF